MDHKESDDYKIFFCVHGMEWTVVWGLEGENFSTEKIWKRFYGTILERQCDAITGINGLRLECRECMGLITGNE